MRCFLYILIIIALSLPLEAAKNERGFKGLAVRLKPAVVQVVVRKKIGRTPKYESSTGFFVKRDGIVVTNFHSVHLALNNAEIWIETTNKKRIPVRILRYSTIPDIAILKTESGNNYPTLSLGNSKNVTHREPVMVMGYRMGVGNSVNYIGKITEKHDDGNLLGNGPGVVCAQLGTKPIAGAYLQTDTQFSNGVSGGPLVNFDGEVVGVANWIIPEDPQLNFSIPIDYVKRLLPNNNLNSSTGPAVIGRVIYEATMKRQIIQNDGTVLPEIGELVPGANLNIFATLTHPAAHGIKRDVIFTEDSSQLISFMRVGLKGVAVSIEELATGKRQLTKTNNTGQFIFYGRLNPGKHIISVLHPVHRKLASTALFAGSDNVIVNLSSKEIRDVGDIEVLLIDQPSN